MKAFAGFSFHCVLSGTPRSLSTSSLATTSPVLRSVRMLYLLVIIITTIAFSPASASAIPVIPSNNAKDVAWTSGSDVYQSGVVIGDHRLDYPPNKHAEWVGLNSIRPNAVRNGIGAGEDSPTIVRMEEDSPQTLVERSSASTTSAWSMPSPFDTNIGVNFTSEACPKFFNGFLSNADVTNCHAVSMLLKNSNSFFHMLTSAAGISHILDTSCSASATACSATMKDLAKDLVKDSNCGEDYRLGNPLVVAAYVSMVAYEPVYRATCLTNPDTNDYCFVDAAMNSTDLSDYYVYFVPLGTPLTTSNRPTCNQCLQAAMAIYSEWAPKDGQPLADTYLPSATQVNAFCGAGFANTNVTVGSEAAVGAGSWTSGRPNGKFMNCILALSVGATLLGIL